MKKKPSVSWNSRPRDSLIIVNRVHDLSQNDVSYLIYYYVPTYINNNKYTPAFIGCGAVFICRWSGVSIDGVEYNNTHIIYCTRRALTATVYYYKHFDIVETTTTTSTRTMH